MTITLTKREFQRFFIYNYYFGCSIILSIYRRLGGPILAGIGLYLYMFSTVKDDSQFGFWVVVICLAYGLFYTIKPLLVLVTLGSKDESFEYKISKNSLFLKDRLREDSISLTENKLKENKKYFFIKLKNKQVIFFPKDLLDEKTISLFEKGVYKK